MRCEQELGSYRYYYFLVTTTRYVHRLVGRVSGCKRLGFPVQWSRDLKQSMRTTAIRPRRTDDYTIHTTSSGEMYPVLPIRRLGTDCCHEMLGPERIPTSEDDVSDKREYIRWIFLGVSCSRGRDGRSPFRLLMKQELPGSFESDCIGALKNTSRDVFVSSTWRSILLAFLSHTTSLFLSLSDMFLESIATS